jgi:hypothetical protein
MGNPDPNNPNTKPQDDKKQSGSDPLGKRSNPSQQGEGRDPMKDPNRQSDRQGDQRKQGGQDTRKPA